MNINKWYELFLCGLGMVAGFGLAIMCIRQGWVTP